ncbi:multidrug resistance-associated protein 1 [Biomphalaria glabrata]|nr:multidrug resistance-associated protein 1 [Biomphalaria glabrata]
MEEFCDGDKIWDTALTWSNNTWPEFTPCFQYTILTWVPCAWLWLSSPVYIYYLSSTQKDPQPIKWLFSVKVFCSLVIILLEILEIAEVSYSGKSFTADLLSPIIWILTLFFYLCLVVLEQSRGVIRSPIIFFFWILTSLAQLIPFYSSFVTEVYDENKTKFAIIVIKYAATILAVFANCFADFNKDKFKGHNPEPYASIISWLSLSWVDKLMITGFKSPLKDEDVFEINPRDQSQKSIGKLLKTWNKEKSKAKKERKKHKDSPKEYDEKSYLLAGSQSHVSTGGNSQVLEDKSREPKVSLFKVLLKCYWLEAVSCQWGMVMYVLSSVVVPIILGWLIDFTENSSEPSWHGYIYALAFIGVKVLYTSFSVLSKYLTNCFALRVCSASIAAVFRKALIISSEARKESTAGEIVNLMSVDSGHLEQMLNYSFWMWVSLIFLAVGIYLLYTVVGIALLAGLGFVVIMFLVNLWVMQKMRDYQDSIMIAKDERVKIINEVLNGIKVIKLYGWEPMFIKKIQEIRDKELKILLKYCILDGVESFAWLVSMFWMLHLMLVTFVLIDEDHYLDANTTFLTMNFIDILKLAINILPILVKDWVKAGTSVMRMNKYLNAENIATENLLRDKTDVLAVRIQNADFAWERNGPVTLQNINLSVTPGQLVAIVGTVGAGKSSLLNALLGEMHTKRGRFNLNSSVAYVPQMAWIQNNSLRENILFGQSYNAETYNRVISACALLPDLDIMPARDRTEIGEKGINLSGGQKQRVSLARAVYSKADIYMLDDPLSAVDSHVGKHIFDQVIGKQGLLSGKTRLLVTHGIQWLPFVDHIVVMSDGQISECGTYEELLGHNGAFAQFLTQYLTKEIDNAKSEEAESDPEIKLDLLKRLASVTSDNDTVSDSSKADLFHLLSIEKTKFAHSYEARLEGTSSLKLNSGLEASQRSEIRDHHLIASIDHHVATDQSKLITEEEMAGGKVNWGVYWHLVKSVGVYQATSIIVLMLCYHVVFNYTNIWLTNWNDDPGLGNFTDMPRNSSDREDKNVYYIGVYTGLGIGQTIFVVGYSILLQVSHVATSRKLHNELLFSIIKAPMSFFDTTPMGRILNRFSQDIATLDNDVFLEAEIALDNALRCVSTVIIISYTMPIFLSVIIPVIIILYFVQQLYIRTSCQLRRITSKNRSPVYAHFSETLSGVSVIRAYQAEERFIADSLSKVDNFQKANALSRAISKWLEARLEMLNFLVIAAATIFAVVSRNDLSPGLVGLAVTYAIRVSTEMNVFTLLFGELENHIVSVERIREYSAVNSEAPWDLPENRKLITDQWPTEGSIKFVNYSTRYRDGLDLVLKNLNCEIKGGEKIGVVGRTGAGKSSMVLSLFRLIEATGGEILIDDVDISKLGLHALRRKITILPQDPVLFAGSLRINLDPFEEKSENELWTALEHAHLKTYVESLPQRLEHEVGEGGENLSMGQRQLVCLARTLLRKTKILILDEATAAVDMETDELIQKTIRAEFSECTILTIAHRLNTVLDYDRIMVLDKGTVSEFDSPKSLLSKPDSMFYAMASQAGLV